MMLWIIVIMVKQTCKHRACMFNEHPEIQTVGILFFVLKNVFIFKYLYNVWLYDKWSILAFWESNWEEKTPWRQVTSFAHELCFILFSYAFFFLFTWLLMNEWSNMCKVISKSLFSGCSLIYSQAARIIYTNLGWVIVITSNFCH